MKVTSTIGKIPKDIVSAIGAVKSTGHLRKLVKELGIDIQLTQALAQTYVNILDQLTMTEEAITEELFKRSKPTDNVFPFPMGDAS